MAEDEDDPALFWPLFETTVHDEAEFGEDVGFYDWLNDIAAVDADGNEDDAGTARGSSGTGGKQSRGATRGSSGASGTKRGGGKRRSANGAVASTTAAAVGGGGAKRAKTATASGGSDAAANAPSSRGNARLRWTPELHREFIHAVDQLGGLEIATPKGIMSLMTTAGMTLQHIKSHLQKYRLQEVPSAKRAEAGTEAARKRRAMIKVARAQQAQVMKRRASEVDLTLADAAGTGSDEPVTKELMRFCLFAVLLVEGGVAQDAGNAATGSNSVVSGGTSNTAAGYSSGILAGDNNYASQTDSVVLGGTYNTINYANWISTQQRSSIIGAGSGNLVSGSYNVIAGGSSNKVAGDYLAVGGGQFNSVSGFHSVVFGGKTNKALGNWATAGGGWGNLANNSWATVLGGSSNTASGQNAYALGRQARAHHTNSMVFGFRSSGEPCQSHGIDSVTFCTSELILNSGGEITDVKHALNDLNDDVSSLQTTTSDIGGGQIAVRVVASLAFIMAFVALVLSSYICVKLKQSGGSLIGN